MNLPSRAHLDGALLFLYRNLSFFTKNVPLKMCIRTKGKESQKRPGSAGESRKRDSFLLPEDLLLFRVLSLIVYF